MAGYPDGITGITKEGLMLIKDSIIEQTGLIYTFPHAKEEILFFYIETTGLSKKSS